MDGGLYTGFDIIICTDAVNLNQDTFTIFRRKILIQARQSISMDKLLELFFSKASTWVN